MRRSNLALFLALISLLIITAPALADGSCPGRSCGPASSNHLGGYQDIWGRWVPGLISNESWFLAQPIYTFGRAVFYAPGVMKATARWHGYSLDEYVDGVALMSPADQGKTVWMRRPGREWEGPFLVVDCAAQTDMYSVIFYNREVVEVGFRTAVRWGMAIPANTRLGYRSLNAALSDIEVAVVRQRPPEEAPWDPLDYTEWWLERMTFTDRLQERPFMWEGRWHVPDVGNFNIGEQYQRLALPSRMNMKPWMAFIRDSY